MEGCVRKWPKKAGKGLLTGKTMAATKDKDKKKLISRSVRAGLQAVGPFYPLYTGRRDSTVQTFWMHCIYASVMCKIAPNVGRNQVVHNKDVQVQFMVTKWPGEGNDGNGLHKSNRNRQNGYGLNGQHNPWTGRSWTGRNERERKNEW